jgi:hypothetical protein
LPRYVRVFPDLTKKRVAIDRAFRTLIHERFAFMTEALLYFQADAIGGLGYPPDFFARMMGWNAGFDGSAEARERLSYTVAMTVGFSPKYGNLSHREDLIATFFTRLEDLLGFDLYGTGE